MKTRKIEWWNVRETDLHTARSVDVAMETYLDGLDTESTEPDALREVFATLGEVRVDGYAYADEGVPCERVGFVEVNALQWVKKNRPNWLGMEDKARGWNDTELWNLDNVFAEFILPRLKKFREASPGQPGSIHEEFGDDAERAWDEILGKMIRAFQLIVDEEGTTRIYAREDWDAINEGLRLFGEYFCALWS